MHPLSIAVSKARTCTRTHTCALSCAQVLRVGDIVRVHRAVIQEYNDEPQVPRLCTRVSVYVCVGWGGVESGGSACMRDKETWAAAGKNAHMRTYLHI